LSLFARQIGSPRPESDEFPVFSQLAGNSPHFKRRVRSRPASSASESVSLGNFALRRSLGHGGKFSREGGTGWDASEATRLVRAACRATPPMRMAPSRSNFPYPAPITCIEARREGCHLREIEECRATKGHLSASFWTSRNGTTALSARISLWHRRVSDAGRSNRLRIRASLALRCMLARKPKWRIPRSHPARHAARNGG